MFPMLGKWKSFDEIDFDSLPEEFVLKCNHDSGSVNVIRNKSARTDKDIESLRKFYNSRVKQDCYGHGREPCYKGIDRYVFAEKFMKDPSGDEGYRPDFCRSGRPCIQRSEIGTNGRSQSETDKIATGQSGNRIQPYGQIGRAHV